MHSMKEGHKLQDTSWLSRTALLIGAQPLERLMMAHVMVVGLGGVGSFAAEFIARAGVGRMTIIDGDVVDPSNRNRQLPALATNHGMLKADIMAERLMAINPEVQLKVIRAFIRPEQVAACLDLKPDFIIDAIDSVTPKCTFITATVERKIPFVSAMGAGGRLDPTCLQVADISKTYNCPFSQQIRKNLKKVGIYKGVQVVFSPEKAPPEALVMTDGSNFKKSAYGTISYMPATFGSVAASVAIRHVMQGA